MHDSHPAQPAPENALAATGVPWLFRRRTVAIMVLVAIVISAVLASFMTAAEKPKASKPIPVPPLVLRDGTSKAAPLAQAARDLRDGKADDARDAANKLLDLATINDPENIGLREGARVVLVLATWDEDGPKQALTKMDELVSSNPDSAYLQLMHGVMLVSAARKDEGNMALKRAQQLAQASEGQLDIARRADDLLHPNLAPGYPPLVIDSATVTSSVIRTNIQSIMRALTAGDRIKLVSLVGELPSTDPAVTTASATDRISLMIAHAIGGYSKSAPQKARQQLHRWKTGDPTRGGLALHQAFLEIWGGNRAAARRYLLDVRRKSTPGSVYRSTAEQVFREI